MALFFNLIFIFIPQSLTNLKEPGKSGFDILGQTYRLGIFDGFNFYIALPIGRITFVFSTMNDELPEIRILSDAVANKIAAGEVIERPASAIKELLENAIDAKADKIDIEFRKGGKTYIKVSDNGHGMRKDQALTALEAHATSKIRSAEDLDTIASFGFRGEALPSIASIGRFTLLTKPASEQVGTSIEIYAGEVKKVAECAMQTGTEIIVEDIFCSVPARRKFLKTDNTEADHIVKLCRLYALARPDVAFSLSENGRSVFKSARSDSLTAQIGKIFGDEISSKLVPLEHSEAFGISVHGAISKPGESWASARNIYTFINGRPVDSRTVYSALKEAYQNAIPTGKYPAAFLFIKLDPRSVDVNVHPAKREVRLKNEFAVRNVIINALADKLTSYKPESFSILEMERNVPAQTDDMNATANAETNSETPPAETQQNEEPRISEDMPRISLTHQSFAPKPKMSPLQEAAKSALSQMYPKKSEPAESAARASESAQTAPVLGWKYLDHLGNSRILFETQSSSLIILSVSAALKRINYDRIIKNFSGERAKSQHLLIPVNIEFERADDEVFRQSISAFETCGFDIEEFGERFYRVRAIPTWLEFGETENFIKNFVELAKEEGVSLGRRRMSEQAFADIAVRRARRASVGENAHSALSLLDELFACKSPMFSPDGRRTCKEITAAEMRAFFGE
jgi:DNA mismatch repair protein MutL